MVKEITDEYGNSKSCEQTLGSSVFSVTASTTGIIATGALSNGLCSATLTLNRLGKTSGNVFYVDLIGDCITKSAFAPCGYLESILNFLDIVNNKDGWSFLQQTVSA